MLQYVCPRQSFKIVARNLSALSNAQNIIETQLSTIRDAGTWKDERILTSPQNAVISVKTQHNSILNFCANNYLGLSNHPDVVKAGKQALDSHGAGLSSVRFICGTQDIHKELERKIAKFHGRDDAILYNSCFDANAGLFEVLLNEDDAIISDELNHASIIDGVRLCKAARYRYRHRDMDDLREKLHQAQSARLRLIASDGCFSMDGNIAPLEQICDIADKTESLVFIDECHATGFLGKSGRGTEEYFNIPGKCQIINSTLGKALGGAAGGYTTGPQYIIDILRQRSRPYLFSNALPPPVVGSASKVFDMLLASSDLIQQLKSNTALFRSKMTDAGFTVLGDYAHPICPVFLKDAKLSSVFADKMLNKGIYVIGFSYPVVPKDKARIRVQLSAAHSSDDILKCIDAFVSIGREMKIIE